MLAILALGLAVAFRQWRVGRAVDAMRLPGNSAEPAAGDSVVEQALRQIPFEVDSEAIKTAWTEDVRGFDLAALSGKRRGLFLRFANSERCTCGCGYTLAACRAFDLTCPVSQPRVQSLYDSVAQGIIVSADGLRRAPETTR